MSTTSTESATRPTRVQLPWARATVIDEATIPGSAEDGPPIELGVALLREDREDGELLLRFFYRAEGKTRRGPVTLRPAEVEALAARLRKSPELRRLVRGLLA